ncbi:hypothetical protein l13_07190 [Neisseria weaveri ATCC 51223]|nr:hypothetical protein l13_07190 [Neisseria weaveri ATCC 51223]
MFSDGLNHCDTVTASNCFCKHSSAQTMFTQHKQVCLPL